MARRLSWGLGDQAVSSLTNFAVGVVVGGVTVVGVVMAWSQVALGAHYATDTIGGIATAMAVVATVALLVDPAAARWSRSTRRTPG